MMKKQVLVAFVLLLLIPVVVAGGGLLFSLINPELAAGHPNYVRNFHRLTMLRVGLFWASLAVAAVLWVLACLLVIRAKRRSSLWLLLAALGPFGFAFLAMLNDRAPAATDIYARFVAKLGSVARVAYELCTFLIVLALAYQAVVLKRTLMIHLQALSTGVPTSQIVSIQNASSGMWAFGESIEMMFLVVLFYMVRPIAFRLVGSLVAGMASSRTR